MTTTPRRRFPLFPGRQIRTALAAVLLLPLTGFARGSGIEPPGPSRLSGFVVLYDPVSVPMFLAHADRFETVYLDGAVLTEAGTVAMDAPAGVVSALAARHVPVELTVSNLVSPDAAQDARLVERVLKSSRRASELVRSLVREAAGAPFAGINIDFEALPRRDGPLFDRFLARLGRALHRRHRMLSVDVPALTRRSAGRSAYLYPALASPVDRVLIMAYDFSYPGSRPGPIAPLWWVRRVLTYARQSLPLAKIALGLPFYGYDWGGPRTVGLTLGQVSRLIARHRARPAWNRRAEAPYFRYRDARHRRHIVYFTDGRSVFLELALARADRIPDVFYWFVGSGAEPVWALVSTYRP